MTVDPSARSESWVERNGFTLLYVVLLAFYVVVPIVRELRGSAAGWPQIFEGIFFVGILGSAAFSVTKNLRSLLLALFLGVPTAVLWAFHLYFQAPALRIGRDLLSIAFLAYVIFEVFRYIFTSPRVTRDVVFASLCIYLLFGLMWSQAFAVDIELDPGAFIYTLGDGGTETTIRELKKPGTLMYFSFATLTTLGYGDIVPRSEVSRMLTTVEAVTAQLYVAVLIARLVGLHIAGPADQSTGKE